MSIVVQTVDAEDPIPAGTQWALLPRGLFLDRVIRKRLSKKQAAQEILQPQSGQILKCDLIIDSNSRKRVESGLAVCYKIYFWNYSYSIIPYFNPFTHCTFDVAHLTAEL